MYRYVHIRLTTVCFPATCTPASVDDGMQMYVGRNRHVAASRRNSDQTAFFVLSRASLHATHSPADMQARIDDQCTHHELNVGHSSHGREMGRGQNARQQSERMNPVTGKLGDKRRRVSLRGGVLGGVIKYDDVLPCLVGRTMPNKRGHESSADIGGRLVGEGGIAPMVMARANDRDSRDGEDHLHFLI